MGKKLRADPQAKVFKTPPSFLETEKALSRYNL
jgi:hypothetical protein